MRGLIALALLAAFLTPLRAQDDLPEGKGRETIENTCNECHGTDRILTKLRSTAEWRSIATSMRAKGATMSDDELNTLVDYLSQNFGLVEDKVNVNKASAKELESALKLPAAEAQAIVRHREANGAFKEWRDLLKVKGVDRARIEAVKDRLDF
jgi:competence ComEA-like helix-hairpin-helix protein